MQWQLRKWKDLEERVEDLDEKRLWNSETERMPHQSIGISIEPHLFAKAYSEPFFEGEILFLF